MPIPLLLPPEENRPHPPTFLVVVAQRAPWKAAPLAPRAIAYTVDLLVVSGLSIYASKLISLCLLSWYLPEIGSGRGSAPLFRRAFSQGQFQLGVGCFAFLALFYFVALPKLTGRTPGLGLLGLKIQAWHGARPGWKELLLRQLGCLLQFSTLGSMYLQALKGPSRPTLQDSLSGTCVVSDR